MGGRRHRVMMLTKYYDAAGVLESELLVRPIVGVILNTAKFIVVGSAVVSWD